MRPRAWLQCFTLAALSQIPLRYLIRTSFDRTSLEPDSVMEFGFLQFLCFQMFLYMDYCNAPMFIW